LRHNRLEFCELFLVVGEQRLGICELGSQLLVFAIHCISFLSCG
jgi:hypothetical protein